MQRQRIKQRVGKGTVEVKGKGKGPKKCAALSMSDSLACLAVDPVAIRQRMCSSNEGAMPLLNWAWRTAHNLRGKGKLKA